MSRSFWASPALVIPMVLIIIAIAARGVCQAMHLNSHADAMMLAAGIIVISSEIALLPLLFVRNATQLAITQAGLIATMVQMFMAVILSAVAMYAMRAGQPFVLWVIPLYWVGLAMLAASVIGAIKRATPLVNSVIAPLQTNVINP